MAETNGLLNRRTGNGTEGSNPSVSAKYHVFCGTIFNSICGSHNRSLKGKVFGLSC